MASSGCSNLALLALLLAHVLCISRFSGAIKIQNEVTSVVVRSVEDHVTKHLDSADPDDDVIVLSRQRRAATVVRQVREFEVAETQRSVVAGLGGDYTERFSFKEPAPEHLQINPVMGGIHVMEGRKLDYETRPEINFTVIVYRQVATFSPQAQIILNLTSPYYKDDISKSPPTIGVQGLETAILYTLDDPEQSEFRFVAQVSGYRIGRARLMVTAHNWSWMAIDGIVNETQLLCSSFEVILLASFHFRNVLNVNQKQFAFLVFFYDRDQIESNNATNAGHNSVIKSN